MKTKRSPWELGLLLLATVPLTCLTVGFAPAASAASVPYSDPSAVGSIGLCGKNGQAVTGGNVNDKPFVWKAVSSVKPPQGYQVPGGKATLLAYQPRPNTPADQWNGDTLTAASKYSSVSAPAAAATKIDFSLHDFIGEFSPLVDGLLELRMYFGAPGQSTYNTNYPATNIRVTGDTWTVVNPAPASCDQGTAISSEVGIVAALTEAPGASASHSAPKPGGTHAPTKPASRVAGSSTPPTTNAPAHPATSAGSSSGATDTVPSATLPTEKALAGDGSSRGSSSTSTVLLIAGGLAVALAAIAGFLRWRRRA